MSGRQDDSGAGGGSGSSGSQERDRAGDERDRASDQRDQAARQRDQAWDRRDRAAGHRDQAAEHRDQAAGHRDQAAEHRDQAAEHRDQAAEHRDQAAEQRDRVAERSESRVGAGIPTDALSHSAVVRREAASERGRASQDRQAGASERTEPELDRNNALADRSASARERESSSHDDLTGVYLRGAGLVELERDIARARRTKQSLVLAFVDVDGLKEVNDSRGHAAGDRILLEVAKTLSATLRSYDLIIRYGGDEFVCAISRLDMADATKRFALVNATLAEAPEPGSITIGLTELQPHDSPEDLLARADAELYRERQHGNTRPR